MKRLTGREEAVMELFWEHGAMFVKDLMEYYPDPKPHINTLSSHVRSLEAKGYIAHKEYGGTYQYYPAMGREECGQRNIENIVKRSLNNSYMSLVSSLVHEEKISVDELKELIEQIENNDI